MPWSTEQPSYPDSFDLAISAGYPFTKQILYYAELLLLNQYCFSLLGLSFLPLVKLKLTSLSNGCHFYVYSFLQHSASVWFLLLPAKFIITKQSYISAQTALFPEIWVAVRVRSSLLHVQESVCMCLLIFFLCIPTSPTKSSKSPEAEWCFISDGKLVRKVTTVCSLSDINRLIFSALPC